MRRPSTVIAILALFIALGGTAAAARHYLITSTSQIKPSVLKSLHGKDGANGAQGPSGSQGPAGPMGSPGTPGSVGPTPTPSTPAPIVVKKFLFQYSFAKAGSISRDTVPCPEGTLATGGGLSTETAPSVEVVTTAPTEDDRAWAVAVRGKESASGSSLVTGYAICMQP